MKKYIIIAAVCLGVGFGGGMFTFWKCNTTFAKPDLGKPDKPISGVKETVAAKTVSPNKIIMPYGGNIIITPTLNAEGNKLHIRAEDKYKWTEQDWPIECKPVNMPFNKWSIYAGVSVGLLHDKINVGTVLVTGGELGFYRNFGRFGIGPGIYYKQSLSNQFYEGGLKVNIKIDF